MWCELRYGGGAIAAFGSKATIEDSEIVGCYSGGALGGGAICFSSKILSDGTALALELTRASIFNCSARAFRRRRHDRGLRSDRFKSTRGEWVETLDEVYSRLLSLSLERERVVQICGACSGDVERRSALFSRYYRVTL